MKLIKDQVRLVFPLHNGRVGKKVSYSMPLGDHYLFSIVSQYVILDDEAKKKALKKLFKRILYMWHNSALWSMNDKNMLLHMPYGDCGLNYKIIPIDGTNDSAVVIWQDYSNEYLSKNDVALVFDMFIVRGISEDILQKNIIPLYVEIGIEARETVCQLDDWHISGYYFSSNNPLEAQLKTHKIIKLG